MPTQTPSGKNEHPELPAVRDTQQFAHTVVVFLEDWQAGRLTSIEVCETLVAAAVARKLIRPDRE